jgi:hypothetical protein
MNLEYLLFIPLAFILCKIPLIVCHLVKGH